MNWQNFLEELGQLLFGPDEWRRPMARLFGVEPRSFRRFVAGDSAPSARLVEQLTETWSALLAAIPVGIEEPESALRRAVSAYAAAGKPIVALQLWLAGKGHAEKDLPAILGISQQMANFILRGQRSPGKDLRVRIEGLTGIPAEAWQNQNP